MTGSALFIAWRLGARGGLEERQGTTGLDDRRVTVIDAVGDATVKARQPEFAPERQPDQGVLELLAGLRPLDHGCAVDPVSVVAPALLHLCGDHLAPKAP